MSRLKSARNLPMYKGILRTPQCAQANLSEERFAERLLIKKLREKTTNLPQWEKKRRRVLQPMDCERPTQMITLGRHMPKSGETYNYCLGEAE